MRKFRPATASSSVAKPSQARHWQRDACLSVVACLLAACSRPQVPQCSDRSSLGTVGPGGEQIAGNEVSELVARVATAGGKMTRQSALVDLLWQEAERQRLGLPGGTQTRQSRRAVVNRHGRRIEGGETERLRSDPNRLPLGTQLTYCGEQLLRPDT